ANFYYLDELEKLLNYGSIRKIISYLDKQKVKEPKHFGCYVNALTTWRDYIEDCKKLEMNFSVDRVLYPRNLYRAHQNTIKQVKHRSNEILNKKIAARAKDLKNYCFEYTGLLVRPAETAQELIDEGKALSHCVGGYSERYAEGKTAIFFIRKAVEPDKPYFTLEAQKDQIIQCRGKNNCSPSQDVKDFVKAFTDQKLTKKKTKNRVRVPA
ncbi:MAG: PcfJ domain-containing protein, partial [Carboxydocellales bacterium]